MLQRQGLLFAKAFASYCLQTIHGDGATLEAIIQTTTGNLVRLIVGAFFVAGAIIGSGALYFALRNQALGEATGHAELLMSALGAVGDYTDVEVLPALDRGAFHKQSVPFFAAKSVFNRVAAKYPDYSYRQVALNPTNTEDRPDPFEVELTNDFKTNTSLGELSGVRQAGDQSLFYVARPIRIEDPNCLACHSTPDQAPPSMVALYGTANGFGWLLHQTVGVQVLSVPVTSELRNAVALSIGLAAGLLVIFGLTYLTLTAALDRVVVGPLRQLAAAADAASRGGSEVAPLPRSASAEIGQVSGAVQRLRTSLEKAMRRAVVREETEVNHRRPGKN